ncbi:DNA helicase protein [Herbaspirillum rubrisubalbicans M1]|uniref:DEAD/DEAH box helicase n=1 Tax=Herbaspirillum rubrisubalbicans TaxID=80842 RepID=UPI00073A4ADF|nr:DEAD/DEAH box helicase [Herbaspirillum rubrisubalbicans]ALU91511.1 DNA helicase protein [Herbaspirillum rubrisubalbicans M1]
MDNFNQQLAYRVANHQQFQDAYATLQKQSLASLSGKIPELEIAEKNRLLRSALILAQSKKQEYATLSQDIVYALATLQLENSERLVCQHILAILGNFPASDFLRGDRSKFANLPWQLQLAEQVRRDENFVKILGEDVLLTDFQVDVWEELAERQYLSIAAPTSAGKSFLIQLYLKKILSNTDRLVDIAYVVPSRSLIHEIQAALTRAFQGFENAPLISSVPRQNEGLAASQSRIFVFTQERLRTAMDESDLMLDYLVVDEAQQIADGARGMLLLSCLEEVRKNSPRAQILFITPGSRSGGPIGSLLGLGQLPTVETALRPVRQNLIYVRFRSLNQKQYLELTLHRANQEPLALEKADVEGPPVFAAGARFFRTIMTLGDEGQNIVYASTKKTAEKIAIAIANELRERNEIPKNPISLLELSDFVKRHVHPEYVLAECIKVGVAFHYGSMPTTLTKAIEEYFSKGAIKYLVCTSTLLQGVNLPARNIFISNPYKGNGNPMGTEDFWNLAGRAGRLSKDTHGNVFLVEYQHWDSAPVDEPRQLEIIPSLSKAFSTARPEMLRFMRNENHESGLRKTNFAESVFTRLFIDAKEGLIERTIERANMGKISEGAGVLKEVVEGHLNKVLLPPEILKRNASISPLRQQAMFDVLLAEVQKGRTRHLIPPHPRHPNTARERMEYVMSLIHQHLQGKETRRQRYFGWFSISWMRGSSLADMIEYQLRKARREAEEKGTRPPEPGEIIVKVLGQVENDLRFHYVRYIGCYIDLLRYAFEKVRPGRSIEIPAIPLFLELGACSKTMISCMELGLSRIAAREVTDLLGKEGLDAVAVKFRLKKMKISNFSLSPIIVSEILRLGLANA